ncbi:lumenal Hsp70 protein [Massospora cicadina]|nr:lumenal Hsp70 protein [Massospora cicadina]
MFALGVGLMWSVRAGQTVGPLDIILNRDSKRKTQNVVAIRGTERTFGVDGQALAMRYPTDVYSGFKEYLGKKYILNQGQPNTRWNRVEDCASRGTLIFTADDGAKYSVEELAAMMLQYANEEGRTAAEENFKDTVLTVPAYANQFERQALLDSGEIAEVNVLTLVNDGSAVALNYAMTRRFTAGPQTHLIFDMGSGSTVATLASFREVSAKEGKYRKNVTFTQVEILGVGYDKTLGGNAFDARIEDLILERFILKHSAHRENIIHSPRSMLKLQKEATRVKQVLSANHDAYSSIESLYGDFDFKSTITRAEFEAASADLYGRVLNPIRSALSKGNLRISDINSIILFGGGVRVPKIQMILKEFAGAEKISQNVNGDEAAALGAVFRGAGLSSHFKVRDIRLRERTMYPVELIVAPESEELEASGKKYTLVEANAPYAENFFFPIKLTSDFNFRLQYKDADEDAIRWEGQVRGLAPVLEEYKERLLEDPKLRLLVSVSTSGIVSIVRAQAVLQLEPVAKKENDANGTSEVKTKGENETKPETEASKKVIEKVNLKMVLSYPCLNPLSQEDKVKSIQKLQALAKLDKERFARDEARNRLESFVYGAPDYVERSEVVEVTSEAQRDELLAVVKKKSEWLSDNSDNATKQALNDQLKELEKLKAPIALRVEEAQKRPAALDALRSSLEGVELYYTTMVNNLTAENKAILAPTVDKITVTVKQTSDWLQGLLAAQEKLPPHEPPVLLYKDITAKQKEIDGLKFRLIQQIIALPPPAKPDTKANASNETQAPKDASEEIPENSTTSKPTEGSKDSSHKEPISEANGEPDEL